MANRISLPFGWSWKLKNSNFSVVNYAWRVKTGFWFSFFVLSQYLFFSHNGTSPRISHTWPMARVGWPTCECTLSSSSCLNRFHVGKVLTGRKIEIVRERKKKTKISFWQATRNSWHSWLVPEGWTAMTLKLRSSRERFLKFSFGAVFEPFYWFF